MNNDYKPMLPNNKIKILKSKRKEYKNDESLNELFSNINKHRFQNWLNSPLKEKEIYLSFGRYKRRGYYIYNTNNEIVTKKHYITRFCNDMKKILEENKYTINNYKQFRDDVASFIYRFSK